MKYLVEYSVKGALVIGGLNLFNQFFDPTVSQVNVDEFINETRGGLKAGAVVGGIIDAIELLETPIKLSPKVQRIWAKGEIFPGLNSRVWRYSKNGKLMRSSEYGNRYSKHGWEIEHSKPKAKGGTGHINNLFPENWRENLRKGTKYPYVNF